MPDRMQFFAVALAIGANLMYSCCDGALSDSSSDQSSASLVNALKQAITDTMIRWLPCASRFLISYKKAIKSRTYTRDYDDVKFDFDATVAYEELTGVQHSIDGSKSNSQDLDDESENSIDLKMLAEAMGDGHLDENDSAPETTLGPIDEHSPLKEDDRPSHAGIRLAESTPSGSSVNMLTTVEAAEERRRRIKSKSLGTRALHKIMKTIKHTRTSASPGSPFSTAASKSEHSQDYGTKIGNDGSELAHISTIDFGSEAIEFLTEKLVELEYALFCMDTMFPLANYLQNIQLFERTPVLACMAFYMSENKRNCHIQRRGFDFIKFFADNQIGISSIALQTPAALIHATTMLSETMEVQYSFCNIVSNVIALDEMARENFIRFNVHLLLERMLLRFHSELSRMVCTIIADLAVQDVYVIQLCQHSMLVDCILQLVEAKQEDVRIQVEGLRALQAIFRVPEMLVAKSKNLSTVKVLRRMKKQLQALLRSSEAQPGGYDREVIEGMLAHPLLAKAACSIS